MTGLVLLLSGTFLVVVGLWRGYTAARTAMLPLVRQGDPTRALVEGGQRVHERSRVRWTVRHVGQSIAWLGIAMYGMYLATVGSAIQA